jgi:hypothetical protein
VSPQANETRASKVARAPRPSAARRASSAGSMAIDVGVTVAVAFGFIGGL